jgi:hypothetical protein
MNSSTRLALLLGLQLAAGAAFVACGSDAADPEPTPTDTGKTDAGTAPPIGNGGLALTYSPMYSAFVEGGAHEAQVPVKLKDASLKGAKFTSSDTSVAVVTDTPEGALITVKKDGTTTISATLGDDSGNARLTVKKYTEAQWKTGSDRFSKSDLAIVPAMPNGAISLLALGQGGTRNANGACNTCHTAQARTLKIENTPLQIAGYSDEELITIFTMGKKPESNTMQTRIPAFAWGMFHAWTVTEEEKQGLIAFLRTQAPKASPATIDYGVKPCPGAMIPANGGIPPLCDNDGNPVMIPGLPGQGGGTDAGTPTTSTPVDAGSTTTPTVDSGAKTGDAG